MTGDKPSTPQRNGNTAAENGVKIDFFFEQPYIFLERKKFSLFLYPQPTLKF